MKIDLNKASLDPQVLKMLSTLKKEVEENKVLNNYSNKNSNKYNLTQEEKELIKNMTPKQKKVFLKNKQG